MLGQQPTADLAIDIPPGPPVPIVREMLCQSEVCLPGVYLACASLDVLPEPGSEQPPVRSIVRGDEFRIVAARTIVLSPGVVHITRDVQEVYGRAVDYREGEFLFLLNYLGEGWYSAWRDGEVVEVEQFWPSANYRMSGSADRGAELIRETSSEVWFGIEAAGAGSGWILENSMMIDPIRISMARQIEQRDPLEYCPE